MTLDGMTALVTGAGGGIGKATAIELAKAGADVAVADLNLDTAKETCAKSRLLGSRGLPIRADIGDLSDIDAMVGAAVGELGGIDIVVNNAGVTRHGALLDITEETWDLMQRINAKGTFFCIQRVARQMVDQGRGGRIINISSTGGKGFLPVCVACSPSLILRFLTITVDQLSGGGPDGHAASRLGSMGGLGRTRNRGRPDRSRQTWRGKRPNDCWGW